MRHIMSSRVCWRCLLAVTAWLAVAPTARADYPEQPIRVLMPFPPGGAVDLVTRLVTERMTADLGRGFVMENRSGAGGVIATEAAAKASPDGYTLLVATPNHTILAALKPKLPYDAEKDLVPVALLGAIPMLLVSYPGAPFTTFAGLVDHAKANTGKLNYSSAGNGTLPHLAMEMMLRGIGAQVAHVPYRGAAPAMTDLLAGHVQLKFDTYATSSEHVAAGKLNALAFASLARSRLMPAVPTLAESGLPGFEGILWIGMLAPTGTPRPIIERLSAAMARAVAVPDLAARLARDGVEPMDPRPEAFAALITKELGLWRELSRNTSVTLD